jgi:murein DD-endopeptidase MepM/ murein hydrolase activator NlpD
MIAGAAAARVKVRLALWAAGAVLALWALLGLAVAGVLGGTPPPPADPLEVSCGVSMKGAEQIPAQLLPLYARAAHDQRLGGRGIFVLAAINKVETDFGRMLAVSSAGAVGWMQFMPATWAAYGLDGDGDGRRDPDNPADAVPAAARYLHANGAPRDWYAAIFAYNHADWYVNDVQSLADSYQGTCRLDAATTASLPAAPPGTLRWPVAGPVTSGFGPRSGRMHEGIDIAAPAGTPVTAAATGTVSFSGWADGYGNYVCVTHAAQLASCYAHLSRIDAQPGQHVSAGDIIGAVGCTGHCFGDHLHFETRLGSDPSAQPADPMPYLTGQP